MNRSSTSRRHALSEAIAAASVLLLAACGGSSSSSGAPTSPGPAIMFTPDRVAGGNSISMRSGAGSSGALLEIEIVATSVTNVQAVDFVLLFPADLLRFDRFERGDFVGAGAQVILGGSGGNRSFEILRTTPAAASGSGTIITLTFTAVAAGAGRLDFFDPVAEDPFGLDIPGIDWIGGAVRIVI